MKSLFVLLFAVSASSALAQTTTLKYFCKATDSNGVNQILVIKGKKLAVLPAVPNPYSEELNFTAKFDPKYKPRGNAPKVRYKGEQDGNEVDAILTESLVMGAKKGYMQVRGYVDSYYSVNWTCFRKQ